MKTTTIDLEGVWPGHAVKVKQPTAREALDLGLYNTLYGGFNIAQGDDGEVIASLRGEGVTDLCAAVIIGVDNVPTVGHDWLEEIPTPMVATQVMGLVQAHFFGSSAKIASTESSPESSEPRADGEASASKPA